MGKSYTGRSYVASRRRKSNWQHIVQLFVLVVALTALAYYLLTNPRFTIRTVHIDGVQTLDVSHIASVVQLPLRSNIFVYLLEHRDEFCRRIVACDPVIQSASVAIDFPNALRLHIRERQPYTVLHVDNGGVYLMDSGRIAYHTVALNDSSWPVVVVPTSSSPIIEGKQLPADVDSEVNAAYNLLNLLSSRQIGPLSDVEEIDVDGYDNVNLRLHNQLLIKLGQEDGLPDRLTMVETALAADPALPTKAAYLDFTTTRPAIMEKQAPAAMLGQ